MPHHVFGHSTLSVMHTCFAQGRPSLFVDFRLVNSEGRVQPHDGCAQGELQVRGLHVARAYFRVRRVPTLTALPVHVRL